MKTSKRNVTAVLAALLGAAILSGVAPAGNPHGTPPGHAKGQASTSASASATTGNSVGVKSSSKTHFNTNAAAGSSATKGYGNGKTAGQIAMKNGAGASTNLYGPGNSQPHKASLCSHGKTHLVDVHALKAHAGSASCASGSTSTSTSTSTTSTSTSTSGSVAGGSKGQTRNGQKGTFTPPSAKGNGTSAGSGSVNGQAKPARPVTGTANFTG